MSYATKAKAVIIEGVAELRDDIDNSFIKRTYERYVGKNAINDPMVQFSVNLPRYMVVIRPTRIISWDFTRGQTKVQLD
jgi:hypothetical protein